MRNRSRSTLFLIEQLIVIAVFALCAAACIGILASAYFSANDSRDVSKAILIAENAAESFKATGGDLDNVVRILGDALCGWADGLPYAIIHYDKHWLVSSAEDAHYKLVMEIRAPEPGFEQLVSGDISVEKTTGEIIIAFPVVARSERYE